MIKWLKNMEWSKKLLVFVEILILGTYILVIISTCKGLTDPLTAFISGVFALASFSFGFYYWKAKNENIRKYAKTLNKEDIEYIASLYTALMESEDKKHGI